MILTAPAPAKVNLFLHVGPVGADGYHPVASLVAFADVGDRLSMRPADRFSLEVAGPFAADVGDGPNLVETAVRALARAAGLDEPGLAVRLEKHLPVASGLGGGSSDAAAALKLARRALGLALDDAALHAVAAGLGADAAMCLKARAALATGRGERLAAAPDLPDLHAVLANPGVPSLTGAVYRAYDADPRPGADMPVPPARFDGVAGVAAWLKTRTRNDLEAPAIALTPVIAEALAAMASAPGARLARVTGSGATVFGLFDDAAAAGQAAQALARAHPGWWVRACRLA